VYGQWREAADERRLVTPAPLVFGLVGVLAGGPKIESGLTVGLMDPVLAVLFSTRTITTLAWCQLKLAGHVPVVGLMACLEDARDRGVLRTVGGVYQFRHATLPDQLADHPGIRGPR
jgi:hypothetical protein